VYLTLPREVLAAGLGDTKIGKRTTIAPMSPPAADPDTLDEVAKLLGNAKNPMIITSNGGRTVETSIALTRLAETWAIPVIQYRPRYLALPTEHPMLCGFDPHAMLPDADLILVVDSDVPWIPDTAKINPECKIVHIGVDPLFSRYPVRGFRTDIALAGSLAPTLDLLGERTERYAGSATKIAARRAATSQQSADYRLRMRMGPGAKQTSGKISAKWMTHCINAVSDENTILVNEYPLVLEELMIDQPGRYFSHPPSGGLGWGMGAALGAKLGKPDATVICAIGDGAYMFGNPTPTHFIGEAHALPVLYVINNNARWGAVHRATLGMYPKGHASAEEKPPFSTLEPSPRYEEIVRASGGYGERVEDPTEMLPALKRALNAVKNEKRQAVLNVCTEANYNRTS
jgi:acetolactate synthase-1/2/3 large subunit